MAPAPAATRGSPGDAEGMYRPDGLAGGWWHRSPVFPKVTLAVLRAGAGRRRYGWVAPPPELSGLARGYSRRCSGSVPAGCCSAEGVAPIPGVSCGHPGSPRGCPVPVPAGCFGTRVMAPVPGVSCVIPGMLRVGTGGMLWRGEGGTGPGAPGDHDGARVSPVGHSWPPKPFRLGGPSPLRTLGVPPAPPAVQGQELLPALGTLGGPWGILGGLRGDMGGH